MPSYSLYSDTAGAVSSGQCLPRKGEQEGEECRGSSRRGEALAWGWALTVSGGWCYQAWRREGKGRSMSLPRKSSTCPHLKDLKTQCMLQTVENRIPAVAWAELPQELLATPHHPLRDQTTALICIVVSFFSCDAQSFRSPTRTNPVQWRCANCLIKEWSCISVIWIEEVARWAASNKRPHGRNAQQWFGNTGACGSLFWNKHCGLGGGRSAPSICEHPASPVADLAVTRTVLLEQLGGSEYIVPESLVWKHNLGTLWNMTTRRKEEKSSPSHLAVW